MMNDSSQSEPAFVIKAQEIVAINYLASDHPRPRRVEWINRGTNQVMRPTTTQMLLRTLFQDVDTPSIQKLRETSGLRVVFRSEREREAFSSAFAKAQCREGHSKSHVVTAMFDTKIKVDAAVAELNGCGAPAKSIALLSRSRSRSLGCGRCLGKFGDQLGRIGQRHYRGDRRGGRQDVDRP